MKKILIFPVFLFVWSTLFSQPGDYTDLPVYTTKKNFNSLLFYKNDSLLETKILLKDIKKGLNKDIILKFSSGLSFQTLWDSLSKKGEDPNGIYNYSKENYVKLVLFISRYPDQMIPIPFCVSIDSTNSNPFSFEIPFYLNQKNETYREMASIFKRLLKNPKSQLLAFNFYIHILPKDSTSSYGIPLGSTSLLVYNEEPKKLKWKKHQQGELLKPNLYHKVFKKEKPIQIEKIDTIYPVLNKKIYRKIKQQLPRYQLKLHPREDVRYQYLNHVHYDPEILDSLHKDDKLYYGAGYQIIKKSRSGRKFTKGYVYVTISDLPEYEGCLFYFDAKSCRFLYAIRLIAIPG